MIGQIIFPVYEGKLVVQNYFLNSPKFSSLNGNSKTFQNS
jgi:hypothetical protein